MEELYKTTVTVLLSAVAFFCVKLIMQNDETKERQNKLITDLAVLTEQMRAMISAVGVNTEDIRGLATRVREIEVQARKKSH